ncbi:MAG: hypothetical protein F6K36_29395 [Symploca sp. SIO3C6]|nr:hypothetical protein [Symploca sp. SIO3C6]NET06367.1 hypothetical protein [Symploca sp. SIO2B6]
MSYLTSYHIRCKNHSWRRGIRRVGVAWGFPGRLCRTSRRVFRESPAAKTDEISETGGTLGFLA